MDPTTRQGLEELIHSYESHIQEDAVAICYGSTARRESMTSDLDLLMVSPEAPSVRFQNDFIRDLVSLHGSLDREIDQEVPYKNKLFYSYEDMDAAFGLDMFMANGEFNIPLLDGMPASHPYFSGSDIKLRLGLNALTTTHLRIGGSANLLIELRRSAAVTLGKLAILVGGVSASHADFEDVREMLLASGSAEGNDYLGYHPDDPIFTDVLRSGLAWIRRDSGLMIPVG